jgi:hypothetical protein
MTTPSALVVDLARCTCRAQTASGGFEPGREDHGEQHQAREGGRTAWFLRSGFDILEC